MKKLALCFTLTLGLYTLVQGQNSSGDEWHFGKIDHNHLLKVSLLTPLDLGSHCFEIGYETKLKKRKYLDFSLGYSPNLQRESFFERDFYGIRSQIMYKQYFEPKLFSKNSGSYYGFVLRNMYLWDERTNYFSRLGGSYIQNYLHTQTNIKSGLMAALGNVRKKGSTFIEFGAMLGVSHHFIQHNIPDEDAILLENGFNLFTEKEGHLVLPTFRLIFKIGFSFKKS